MRRLRLVVLLAAAFLWACSANDTTDVNAPKLGRYSYRLDHNHTGNYDGVLVITFATPDSIAGRWEVPAYQATLLLGARDGAVYAAMASAREGSGVYAHRFVVDARGELQCTGSVSYADPTRQWTDMCSVQHLTR